MRLVHAHIQLLYPPFHHKASLRPWSANDTAGTEIMSSCTNIVDTARKVRRERTYYTIASTAMAEAQFC